MSEIATSTLAPPQGVGVDAWLKLARERDGRWEIPERDSDGEVIGTAHRHADGSKTFEKGGKRGLILDFPLDLRAGLEPIEPIYVCEGASDTAVLMTIGLHAVGVPMAGACADRLAALLKGLHAVIVADDDEAGESGARKLADQLVLSCESVRIIKPPKGAKDAREAVVGGATAEDFHKLAKFADLVSPPDPSVRAGGNEFSWLSVADIGPAAEPEWIFPGYIAGGAITLLSGQWKGGKTTLLTHLVRDAYTGSGLVESAITGPTLFVSEESSTIWAHRREQHQLDPRILLLQRQRFARTDRKEWSDLVENIIGKCMDTGAELVIIDTLAGLWPVTSENDAAEVSDALAPLRGITETGAALLLVHHPRKGDSAQFTSARGSGALSSFPDILIELRPYTKDDPHDTRRLITAIGRFEGTPCEMVFELGPNGYTMLGQPVEIGRADDLDTVAGIVGSCGGQATQDQIRAQWPSPKIGKGRLGKLLRDGAEAGRLTTIGRGVKGDPLIYHLGEGRADSFPPNPQT